MSDCQSQLAVTPKCVARLSRKARVNGSIAAPGLPAAHCIQPLCMSAENPLGFSVRARCDADNAVSMLPPINAIVMAAKLVASESSLDAASAACASCSDSAAGLRAECVGRVHNARGP
jgi:uncharacterized caspase-like protein